MKTSQTDRRWVVLGCAILALALGLLLPRPGAFFAHAGQPDATVPPQLTKPDTLPAPADASPSPSVLTIDVCGAVHKPGVYRLAPGERVVDALKQAAGALPEADLDQVNLALPLADAMKVCLPRKGEVIVADLAQANDAGVSFRHPGRHRHPSRGRSSHKLAPGQTLNVNTASIEELTQLPGVGPGLAQRIVDFRQQNGPFQTVEDLQNVPGLGPSKFDRLAPFVHL
jgi:competence protein ComEA